MRKVKAAARHSRGGGWWLMGVVVVGVGVGCWVGGCVGSGWCVSGGWVWVGGVVVGGRVGWVVVWEDGVLVVGGDGQTEG